MNAEMGSIQLIDLNQDLAPQVGLEPTTLRLTAECSAIELLRSVQAGNFLTPSILPQRRPSASKRLGLHLLCKVVRHCLGGASPGGERTLDGGRLAIISTHKDTACGGDPHRGLLPLRVALLG